MKNYIGIQDDRHRLIDHDHRLNEKIADLQYIIQPQFIAIDAITAGEGRMLTPIPFDLGLIIMGNSQVAFDAVCCRIIGVDPTTRRSHPARRASAASARPTSSKIEITRRRHARGGAGSARRASRSASSASRSTSRARTSRRTPARRPSPRHGDYCWGGCPGAIEEAIEILRLFDKETDEKMPRMHVVFGAYDGESNGHVSHQLVQFIATRMRDGSIRQRRARLDETPAGSYVIDPDQDLVIPYLPDPVAGAVTVFGAPGAPAGSLVRMEADGTSSVSSPAPLDAGATPEALLRVGFGDPHLWPDLLPFRLVLAEGDVPPRWDPGVRALVLSLPPGGRSRIELSCAPSRAHLDELAPRAWAHGRHPDAEHVALAEAGRVWQISPARHVELVHAVQRPLEAPVINLLVPSRSPGDTSVLLEGTIEVHGATSERLDLEATWEEPAGRGSDSSPRQRHAHVFEHPLHVSYDPLPDDLAAPSVEFDGIRYEEQTDRVRLTIPPPRVPGEPVRPARTPRHELGDKRHRKITYEAVAASRFREYLPEQVWADPSNVTRRSAPFVVDVPSTAAPVAPSVVQVLPTFAWNHDVPEGSGTQSVRRGGGLRVYLEPPWFSSGEGELLGVVLRPAEVTEPRDDRMTRWGMDPIWDGVTPTKWPTLADALNAASTARGLRLGPGGPQVDVAGYPVAWDDERKLWSSDIALDVRKTHTPFVRLALVRWQPSSLPGLELSPLVLAELAQPAPDRVLTILRSSPAPRFGEEPDLSNPPPQLMDIRLRLQGPGPSTRTTVTVQRRMEGTLDEVGWVDVTGSGITVGMEPPGSEVRWAARIHFDDVNSAKFRLLVRESEVFPEGRERTLFLETIRP